MQDLLRAAGLLAALLAILLQLTTPFCTLMVSAAGLLAAALWVTDRQVRVREHGHGHEHSRVDEGQRSRGTSHLTASLRWDGEQWWWHPAASAHRASAGEPLATASPARAGSLAPAVAVTPHVLLDVEDWLLLRLVPAGSERRFWRHHCLAVSRRQQGGHWSLLRIHLFMART